MKGLVKILVFILILLFPSISFADGSWFSYSYEKEAGYSYDAKCYANSTGVIPKMSYNKPECSILVVSCDYYSGGYTDTYVCKTGNIKIVSRPKSGLIKAEGKYAAYMEFACVE